MELRLSIDPHARWRAVGATAHGEGHRRLGQPNQDALLVPPEASAATGLPVIIAVADGHGAIPHLRSGIGAALAVQAASEALRAAWHEAAGRAVADGDPMDRIPDALSDAWHAAVARHATDNPFTKDERDLVVNAGGSAMMTVVEDEPAIAYGTTVLAAMVTARAIVVVQLGDGDIIGVHADGTARRLVPQDARHVANFTTSLCQPNAADDMKLRVIPRGAGDLEPVLVLLATDGYANSFRTEADFLEVASDCASFVASRGLVALERQWPAFLEQTTVHGSGDDITAALLTCIVDGQ